MSRIKGIALVGILLALGAWYAFRPELAVIDRKVSEAAPPGKPVAMGDFISHAHTTKGSAQIFSAEGRHYLRLDGFETSNGPDVRVYLVAAGEATTEDKVLGSGFIDLGRLKGNIGAQNYELPDDFDPEKHRAVSIWCARFNVNFASAALRSA